MKWKGPEIQTLFFEQYWFIKDMKPVRTALNNLQLLIFFNLSHHFFGYIPTFTSLSLFFFFCALCQFPERVTQPTEFTSMTLPEFSISVPAYFMFLSVSADFMFKPTYI